MSEPTTDLIPDDQKTSTSGFTAQILFPIVFSEKFFAQVTPIYSLGDFNNSSSARYLQEVMLSYALSATIQASVFYRGVFADKDHTLRAGVTIFFVGG